MKPLVYPLSITAMFLATFLYYGKRINYGKTATRLFSVITITSVQLLFSGMLYAHPSISNRIHFLTDQITEMPHDQYQYIQRALAYSNNNQPQLALQDIKTAKNIGPVSDVALAHGILLYREREFGDAKIYFDDYLSSYPNNLAALEYRARLLRDANDYDKAIKDFLKIFRLNPQPNPGHFLSAAQMMIESPNYSISSALELLDKRMSSTHTTTQLQRFAIALEKKQANYQGAISRLDSLDEKLKATPSWKLEAAQFHVLAGQPHKAKLLLKSADEKIKTLTTNPSLVELQQKISALTENLSST
jgi:tetratricopeptide (TPR) repeat protein